MLLELKLSIIKYYTFNNPYTEYFKIFMLTYVWFNRFKFENRSNPIRITLPDRDLVVVVSNSSSGI